MPGLSGALAHSSLILVITQQRAAAVAVGRQLRCTTQVLNRPAFDLIWTGGLRVWLAVCVCVCVCPGCGTVPYRPGGAFALRCASQEKRHHCIEQIQISYVHRDETNRNFLQLYAFFVYIQQHALPCLVMSTVAMMPMLLCPAAAAATAANPTAGYACATFDGSCIFFLQQCDRQFPKQNTGTQVR